MANQTKSTLIGLLAYALVVLAPPALKLAHVAPMAGYGWAKATCLLWGPWALLLACAAAGLGLRGLRAIGYALLRKKQRQL